MMIRAAEQNILADIGRSKHPDQSRAFIKKYSDPFYRVLLCHEA